MAIIEEARPFFTLTSQPPVAFFIAGARRAEVAICIAVGAKKTTLPNDIQLMTSPT
jgi:hypothetical protein